MKFVTICSLLLLAFPAYAEAPKSSVVQEIEYTAVFTRYSATSSSETIKGVFGDKASEAILIARCESGLNNLALNELDSNGLASRGLFQINDIHGYSWEYLAVPYNNAKIARALYQKRGWYPWLNCAIKVGLIDP